ncbi:hypothetical protein BGX23_007954 [Mortierella sp. AD031]|nr:hypothetical protein BGX23_007954 [Mortierella sp. AD031]KAG0196892.1 hypothetical protein BGX33_001175 [Mortierella sp. NVP41]
MKSSFLASALLLLSLLASSPNTVVHAGPYSLLTPTAATRWQPGQPGLVTILSTDKAKASTKPTDRLLTITLRISKGGLFGGSTQVAVIRDGVQLLVPAGSAESQAKLEIANWVVPANVEPGAKYIVQVSRAKDGFFDIPDKVDSAHFQVIAAPVAPPPPPPTQPPGTNTSTPAPPTIPTANTTTLPPTPATPTSTAAPLPTLPPGQTCADIQQQCAGQNRTFLETNPSAVCQCGPIVIVPVVKDNGASGNYGGGVLMSFGVLALSLLMSYTLL